MSLKQLYWTIYFVVTMIYITSAYVIITETSGLFFFALLGLIASINAYKKLNEKYKFWEKTDES